MGPAHRMNLIDFLYKHRNVRFNKDIQRKGDRVNEYLYGLHLIACQKALEIYAFVDAFYGF